MAMDLARVTELAILAKQQPVNEAMERGDSAVQQFYCGTTVFVTGGSGFLGKHLIEKLLRSCEIKKIYMLLRPKKEKNIQHRLTSILKDPLYDTLRQKKPNFTDKIVAVDGEVAEIGLGLSEKNITTITEEVDVIIHMAATVRFNEPLGKAGLINVRGTREVVRIAKKCKHLKLLNHISTAFAHATKSRINTDVKEQFYPCPIAPDVFIDMIETMDKDRLNAITPALIEDWPNTYTFTKVMAEEIIRNAAGTLPMCILKPPLVLNSYIEPTPGWIDHTIINSPSGALLGFGLGVIHVVLAYQDTLLSYAPVDYVNNAIIASGWDSVENHKDDTDVPIYTVSTSKCQYKWRDFSEMSRSDDCLRLVTPKALWYNCGLETSNKFIFWLLTWLLHYIPAYIIDTFVNLLGVRPKGIPSLIEIYSKTYKMQEVYEYFSKNEWNFVDDNLTSLINRLSPEDRAIYNCDVNTFDLKEFFKAMIVGTRRFIIKDNLQDTDYAYRKQRFFMVANAVFVAIYAYLICRVVYMLYSTVAIMVLA